VFGGAVVDALEGVVVVAVVPPLTVVLAAVVVPVAKLVVLEAADDDVEVIEVATGDEPDVVSVELLESSHAAKPSTTTIVNAADIARPPFMVIEDTGMTLCNSFA
jgi:hypothetical protein